MGKLGKYKKLVLSIESNNGVKACHVFLPEKLGGRCSDDSKIGRELTRAFDRLGLTVLSVQRVIECGMEITPANEE